MKQFGFLAFLATVLLAFPAHADEDRTEHYKGEAVKTSQEALKALKDHNAEIAEILKKEELEFLDLENIHEISYSLENAIDKLIADQSEETSKLEAVDEAVQAIHYASENQEEDKTREWFAKLEPAVNSLDIKVTDAETEENQPKETAYTQTSEKGVYEIFIKDHTFTPAEIIVPAGEKIKLIVHNQDPTPEEFESDDFRREKIIPGNSKATILVGVLKPGKYHFFGEFNLDKANGYLIVK